MILSENQISLNPSKFEIQPRVAEVQDDFFFTVSEIHEVDGRDEFHGLMHDLELNKSHSKD